MVFFPRLSSLRLGAIALLCAITVAACGGAGVLPLTQATSVVGDPEVFEVATEPAFPPFEFLDQANQLQGFDIDLMNSLGKRLGLSIRYIQIPFDGLIPMLEAVTADAAISAITVTPERAATVDFSRPYFKSGLAIAVRQSTNDIAALSDLQGRTVAVKLGTTGADIAATVDNIRTVTFDSTELSLQELASGNVDAVINDAPATLGLIASGQVSGIKLVGEFLTQEYYAIALPRQSANRPLIDQALAALIADGTYEQIYRRWFKAAPPPLPAQLP